ncbi:MAG TPA: outer membrane beta-barrel protein [Ignavibacteria bacterium]|nr:outer membrane beta-barrel protein [Ignavibacteria bacterium]
MKKTFYIFLFFIFFTEAINAQTFKPSVNVIARGNYSFWLSDSGWKNAFKSFPGFQVEAVVNLNSNWGIAGTFASDFIPFEDGYVVIPGSTVTRTSTNQFSGYIGPRYYINIPGNKMLRIYIDAAAGLYSFTPGTFKITDSSNPPKVTEISFSSLSQFGLNAGAGLNINLGTALFGNIMVRYHNILKKTGAVFNQTTKITQGSSTTSESVNLPAETVHGRSYFQIGVGIGYSFGL